MSKIIGIDLGTTNSCVAIKEGSQVKVIHSPEGQVIAEVQRGYRLHGRVLRPALVRVSTGKSPTPDAEPVPADAAPTEAETADA